MTRTGEILHHPLTDSHSDLIALHQLMEGKSGENFVRVEFTPLDHRFDDPETYELSVDEDRTPAWFDDDRRANVAGFLRGVITRMIVREDKAILIGGAWILSGQSKIEQAKNCRIVAMCAESNVGVMRESSNVGEMRESSNVGVMWGSSNVGVMRGSSNVGEMWESSNVGVMWGSSNVTCDKRINKPAESVSSAK